MTQENTKRVEIDVLALLQKLWTKKVFILFTAFYVAVFAFLGTYFLIQPTYTSSTRIYVVNQANDGKNLSAQDLQAGTFLTKDYKEIITSNDVLSEVIKDEKLNMTEAELAKMISVNIPTDTRLISISVNAKTGQDAQTLANKVREVASEKIKNVTKVEDVTTLEEAKLPESPSSPNIKRNVLLGAVLGGFLAVVGVLVREILDDRIRRPEDVEDALGMTLLGIVPDTDKISGAEMPLLKLVKSKQNFAKQTEEYYNAIRTNIQFSGAQMKVIAVSSVEAGEGKSTTSVNLAISFASVGLRTLLIDADTRNSVLSGTFKSNEPYKGLSNFLSGNADLNETICQTDISGLDVIASGPVPPNPTSLLQNDNFRHLMEVARSRYDYVIIDTPPIGLVIDAVIIAHQSDASLLVTAAGKIKRRFVTKAVEQLEQSGSQFLGVVLNKVDMTVDKYGSYGSYGSYGEYGKKSDQKEGHSRAHRRRKG